MNNAKISYDDSQYYGSGYKLQLVIKNLLDVLKRLSKRPLAVAGGVIIIVYIVASLFAPVITTHNPNIGNLRDRLIPPVWQEGGDSRFLLGTDNQGRDLLTRIIFGGRVSLAIGFLAVGISAIIGSILGAFAGFYQGKLDNILSRFADLLLAFPYLIFAIGAMAFMGPGFLNLIIALSFKSWVEFFRLSRGEMLRQKNMEYVEAARMSGQKPIELIFKEIFPNIFHTIFVLATLRMGDLIIMEASLSFLGLGLPANIPAWGSMVAAGRDSLLVAWWVSTLPGFAILFLVLSINLFGEGLRDTLDPKMKVE